MTQTELIAAALLVLVMLAGVVGIVIPVLPDLPLIWGAALIYGFVDGYDRWVDFAAMAALTVLAVLGFVVDLALGPVGAAKSGASWEAIAGSLVGGLIGFVFFPPLGAIIGALIGVFIVEYQRRGQNMQEAWTAVKGFVKGYGLSILIRLGLAGVMIMIWAVWVFVERG